jgi:hypothetical protein
MSNIDKVLNNRPRFSWEITIADVIQLLVLVAIAVKLYDQVQVHELRISSHDSEIKQMAYNQNDQNRRLSVLEDRQGRFESSPMESHGNGTK